MLPLPPALARALVVPAGVALWLALSLSAGPARAAAPWPGETWQQATVLTGLDSDFQNNLSGAHWNPETRTLFVCLNGPGRFWALVEDGDGGLVVDEQGGRRGEWSISGDIEGITQVDPLAPSVYVINEASGAVEQYDISVYGSPALVRRWNLSAQVAPAGGAGAEGITFVPDEWLDLAGFTDGSGLPYTSRNGMGGLMFVAHQSGGVVYAFDLDPDSDAYDFVGAYRTSRGESSGLEFDRSSGKLFVWHNTGANYLEMTDLTSFERADGQRQLTTVVEYTGPRSGNLEGVALPPASSGDGWCFLVDDDNQDGGALSWYRDCVLTQVGHDRYGVEGDSTLTVVSPGVRANDAGPATAVVLLSEPAHGQLVGLVAGAEFDGTFVYVPDSGFTGTDGFTYKAADGDDGSTEAIVLIDVREAAVTERVIDACTIERCAPETGCVRETLGCDDGDACTLEWCDPEVGCVAEPLTCDDGDACTVERCDSEVGCVAEPLSCDDGDACTVDSCDRALGCGFAPVVCDDDDACTVDSCDPGGGCVFAPLTCDDGDACTVDSCDPGGGCVFVPLTCDDGDACTVDVCDPEAGCVMTPLSCDDGDPCTADACDPFAGCVYTKFECDAGDSGEDESRGTVSTGTYDRRRVRSGPSEKPSPVEQATIVRLFAELLLYL